MENESYDEFLHEKIVVAPESGFEAKAEDLNPRYFADAVGYLRGEEAQMEQASLFDLI